MRSQDLEHQEDGSEMTKKRKYKQATLLGDSQTNVNFGVWSGRRVVVGIRCDEKLYAAFKPVARRVFGSVCNPIESFMASVIGLANTDNVNFGNTVEIGKLVIERNLRSRRKLVVEEETEVTETKTIGCSWCHKPAVGIFKNRGTGNSAYACEFHSGFLRMQSSWAFVEAVQR